MKAFKVKGFGVDTTHPSRLIPFEDVAIGHSEDQVALRLERCRVHSFEIVKEIPRRLPKLDQTTITEMEWKR